VTERVREVREALFADVRAAEMFPVAISLEEGLALRDWVRREGARADDELHEWLVLRTGSHDAYLRPFFEFVDF
jgi:hypothetical protein